MRHTCPTYSTAVDPSGDETNMQHVHVRLSRRERRALSAGRLSVRDAVIRELTARGVLDTGGCDCSHCRNDWDCCGRFIVSGRRTRNTRRGLSVVTYYTRNI